MRSLTLSGWGQPANALENIAPKALTIDYAKVSSAQAALATISQQGKASELVIGWSLGGQLAVRAIAAGLLKPRKLVLIATPFQFAARPSDKLGMPLDLFTLFRDNYATDPERTLTKAWASIMKGDQKADKVREYLDKIDKAAILQKNWLAWLDILQNFSCRNVSFSGFPSTLLIHGDKDAVVYPEQSHLFRQSMQHATFVTMHDCGHAPHWHDAAQLQRLIVEFWHV